MFRRDLAHLPAHDSPWTFTLPRPHARVAKGAAMDTSAHLHHKPRAERRDCDVGAHPPDAQLLRIMGMKSNDARPVRLEVLRLGSELSVGSGEEQVEVDQPVERADIRIELRPAKLGF